MMYLISYCICFCLRDLGQGKTMGESQIVDPIGLIRLLVCSEKFRHNKVNYLKPIVYQSKSRPMLSNTNLIDWLTPRTHACSTMSPVTHPTVKTPTTSTCTATPPSGVNKITTQSSNLIAHRILDR